MHSMKGTMFAAVALVALAACSKEKAPEAAPVVAAPTSATVSSPPATATTAMATDPAAPAAATMATAATSGPISANTAQEGDSGDRRQVDKSFSPAMDAQKRDDRVNGWQRAVRAAIAWADK